LCREVGRELPAILRVISQKRADLMSVSFLIIINVSVIKVRLLRNTKVPGLSANFEVTILIVRSGGAFGYKSGKGALVRL
jgi:hypothetical protein